MISNLISDINLQEPRLLKLKYRRWEETTEEEKNSASSHPTATESMTDKDSDNVDSGAGLFYAKDAPLWSAASTSALLERPRPRETTLSSAKKKLKTDMRDEILMHMKESDTTDD